MERNRINITWALILVGLLVGCGPKLINIRVLKPAELTNIGVIKKIAVMDFETVGNDKRLGKTMSSELVAKLVENGYYKVVEREQLKKILGEHELTVTGLLDPSKAQQIGKLLGVDGLIFGTVSDYSHQDSSEPVEREKMVYSAKTKKTYIVKEYYYQAKRTAQVAVNLRIASVATGEIIASTSQSAVIEDVQRVKYTPPASKSVLEGLFVSAAEKALEIESPEEKAKKSALSLLAPKSQLLGRATNNVLYKVVVQIAPHFVSEKRTIEKGKDPLMKNAYEFVKREMWEEAKETWDFVLQNPAFVKDHPAAHYNLGVYYETMGDLDKAEIELTSAYKLKSKKLYLDAWARIKQRKKEQEKLEKQLQKEK